MRLKQKISLMILSFAASSMLMANDISTLTQNVADLNQKVDHQDNVLNKYGSALIKIIKDKSSLKSTINEINTSLIDINETLSTNKEQLDVVKQELNQNVLKELKELAKEDKNLSKEIKRIEFLITKKGDETALDKKIEDMILKNNGSDMDETIINKLIEVKINQNNKQMIKDLNKKVSEIEKKNVELMKLQDSLTVNKVALKNLEKSTELKIKALEGQIELISKNGKAQLVSNQDQKEEIQEIEDGYYIIKSDISKKVVKDVEKVKDTTAEMKVLSDKIIAEVISLIDKKNIEMENRIYGVVNKKFSKYDERFEKIEGRLDILEKTQKRNFEILKRKIQTLEVNKDIQKVTKPDGYKEIDVDSLRNEIKQELKEELKNELKSDLMSQLEDRRAKFKDIAHRLSDKINYIHEYQNMEENVKFYAHIGYRGKVYSANKPFFYEEDKLNRLNKNRLFEWKEKIVVTKANSKGWMKIIKPEGAGWIGQQHIYIEKRVK